MGFGPSAVTIVSTDVTSTTVFPCIVTDGIYNQIEAQNTLDGILRVAASGVGTTAILGRSGDTFVVRQPGGTAGTDEVRISHDGTDVTIQNKNPGYIRFKDDAGASIMRLYSNGGFDTNVAVDCALTISTDSQLRLYGAADDAALKRVAVGVIQAQLGSAGTPAWFQSAAGLKRLSTNFTNATTTQSNLTALSVTLTAGRTYSFRIGLFVADSVAADGVAFDMNGGSATATDVRARILIYDTALVATAELTSLAGGASAGTITGASYIEVIGTITVNAGGTFIPRLAQKAHTTGTLTAYAGSHMWVEDMP